MEDIFFWFWFIMIICVLVAMGLGFRVAYKRDKAREQLDRYWDVQIGMSEIMMLNIMGEGYDRSLLKNGRVKYEWRINASSYGTYYKGFSTRNYTGVRKVTIYTKDGFVEEVKPYNV